MRHTPTHTRQTFQQALSETETSYEVQLRRAGSRGLWDRFDGSHMWDEAVEMHHRAERTHPDYEVRTVRTVTTHQHAVMRHI
jgi:hypothetical protein